MAVLYFRDPSDGQWKPLSTVPGPEGPIGPMGPTGPTGPSGTEVAVGTIAPTDPDILLWLDEGSNYP